VQAVVLPETRRLDRLRRLITFEPEVDPLRRLAALIEVDDEGAVVLAARVRFPNAWARSASWCLSPRSLDPQADARSQRRAIYRLGVARYRDLALPLTEEGEMTQSRCAELLDLPWRLDTAGVSARRARRRAPRHPARRAGRPAAHRCAIRGKPATSQPTARPALPASKSLRSRATEAAKGLPAVARR
jgi:hypothetical protein